MSRQIDPANRALFKQVQLLQSELQKMREALETSQEENHRLRQSVTRYGDEITSLRRQLSPEAKAVMLECAQLRSKIARLEEQLAGRESFLDAYVNREVAKQVTGIRRQLEEKVGAQTAEMDMQIAAMQREYEAREAELNGTVSQKEDEIATFRRQLAARNDEIAEYKKLLPESTLPGSIRPANRVSFKFSRQSGVEPKDVQNGQPVTTTLPVIPLGR